MPFGYDTPQPHTQKEMLWIYSQLLPDWSVGQSLGKYRGEMLQWDNYMYSQSRGFQLKNYRPFSSRQSIREYPCGESCASKRWTGWPNRTFPSQIWFSEFHAFWQYYKVRQAFLFRKGIKVSKNQHQLKKCTWGNCDCSRQKDIHSQRSTQCLCLLYMLKSMM